MGDPIAAQLVPGWTIEWIPVSRDQIDQLIPGALAVCRSDKDAMPTREIATVYVVTPWPERESLEETLWHELTHALMSDLVQLIPDRDTAAGVLVEEKIVERLGKILARVPMAARRAIGRSIQGLTISPALRARLAAAVPPKMEALRTRARGGQMDAETLAHALECIEKGDAEAAKEILKKLIVEAAAGGAPAGPAGAAHGKEDAAPPPPPSAPEKESPSPHARPEMMTTDEARKAARKEHATMADRETLRARQEAKDAADEIKLIAADQRVGAKEGLIAGLRARLGPAFTPAIERRIHAAPTYQEAKDLAAFAEELGGGLQRARAMGPDGKPLVIESTPPDAPVALKIEDLVKEGIPAALAQEISETSKSNPKLAAHSLSRARARLSTTANPWLPPAATKEN